MGLLKRKAPPGPPLPGLPGAGRGILVGRQWAASARGWVSCGSQVREPAEGLTALLQLLCVSTVPRNTLPF